MKRKLSASLVLAAVLLLAMAAIGIAATRFGILQYRREQAENETYIEHILAVDEMYENEYLTLTVNDAVFDGVSLSMTMDIQPKEGCGEGVYVYPRVTAQCGGKKLDVEIESCFGDFFNGFWVPERDQGILYANGRYGADYTVVTESESGIVADPQQGSVIWTVSFDIIKPVYPVKIAPAMYDEQGNETMAWLEWLQLFEEAYKDEKILLSDGYSLIEYDAELPKPQGMNEEEWQSMRLPERLIASGAFERVDQPVITFTTQKTEVKALANPQVFDLGDYEVKVTELTIGFAQCDYRLEVTKKPGLGKTAGQEYLDGEPYWQFAVLADGVKTWPSSTSEGVQNFDKGGAKEDVIFHTGRITLTGETDSVTFVPCLVVPEEGSTYAQAGAVYKAQKPVNAEQESLAFTVKVE